MSSAYFVSEFGDAFAGGCATGLGWFLYGAACSCGFLSKTSLSSLLSQQRAQVSAETNLDREHKQRTRKSQWRGGEVKVSCKAVKQVQNQTQTHNFTQEHYMHVELQHTNKG